MSTQIMNGGIRANLLKIAKEKGVILELEDEKYMNYSRKFEIKEEHLKLLKNFNVDWYDAEYGAPMINPKRPYGNSDVELDIGEILGWEIKDNELSDEQSNEASKLHEETKIALQICLYLLKFEIGLYETEDEFFSNNWKKLK